MKYDPERHHRRSIRLKGYDYSQAGAYFITIVTQDRACLFGEVVNGEMQLNAAGWIVHQCWEEIPAHFPHVSLDAFVVMPNHVHGIIVITEHRGTACPERRGTACPERSTACRAPTEKFGHPVAGSVPTVIRSFKSAATKYINTMRGTPAVPVWQRNYYEHIIRNEKSLNRIRQYITNNPARWEMDRENPATTRPEPEDA